MGTEYKINIPEGIHSLLNLEELRSFRHFWKQDERYGCYFLGRMPNSEWPEVMVWAREEALGITVNGGSSQALDELKSFVGKLKDIFPGLEITDWESGDDLSDDFFSS